jgi:hypothetical protein
MAVFGAGCGKAKSSSTQVTRAQLALMVLPKSALGKDAAGLRIYRPISGYLTNAKAAHSSLDPLVTETSLSKGGRLGGYAIQLVAPQARGEQMLRSGAGLIAITTNVDLYRSAAAAAAEMRKLAKDGRALVGKPVNAPGETLERFTTFPVPQIADAAGWKLAVLAKPFHVYFTQVEFRDGRLLALASEARADTKNVDAALIAHARALEKRIGRGS